MERGRGRGENKEGGRGEREKGRGKRERDKEAEGSVLGIIAAGSSGPSSEQLCANGHLQCHWGHGFDARTLTTWFIKCDADIKSDTGFKNKGMTV